ncbi:MAG: hypothetical protein EGQ96_07920 [Prevotella sp.]|nr:hypothetical protein [Prevotella sp.]
MKKQFGLPLMLASALAFSACSSDDVAENGAPNGSYDFTKGGYMAVNINLPSKSAGAFKGVNDKLDDGLPSEYAVKKATLVLFKKATGTGATEGDATFHSIYDLGNISMSMDGTQQITSTVKVVAQADDDAQDKELLGLVILNGSPLVDVAAQKINGKTLTAGTTTFSELATSITDGNANSYYSAADGFLMMNAPLAKEKGGATPLTSTGAGIATLVDVTSNVYGTKEEALAKTAANFYVERALAKVTFNVSDGKIQGSDVTLDGATQTNVMPWEVDKWNLDVTNKKSYFVHNMKGIDNTLKTEYTIGGHPLAAPYRFIGSDPVRATATDLKYRTYWGIDPNYSSYAADFDTKAADADIVGEFGAEHPQYCFENTFDVNNQNQNQTTRAIVKVKLNNGNDFYVFNGDKSKLYSFDGCVKRIKGDIANLKNVHDWIVANLKAGETYDITATGNADVTLNNSTDYTTSAMVKVTNFSVKITATQSAAGTEKTYTLGATDVADLNAALKNNVTKYEGGIAYYPIRIKHFGNELTPWNNYNATTNAGGHQAKAGDVYGLTAEPTKAPARFLGRYGVLRNNWYELEVNSITGIGEPRIPQVPTTSDPDDELKQFISVNINILSWAKRVQKEDL